jgi:hypothetical protein
LLCCGFSVADECVIVFLSTYIFEGTKIMAAKKAPAKKVAAKKAPAKKTPPVKRTDRTGASGFGMTKQGVEDRAIDASSRSYLSNFRSGGGISGEYSNLLTEAIVKDQKNKKSENQLDREALRAGNAVRKKYGVKPKKK